jgi:hypothetical protein
MTCFQNLNIELASPECSFPMDFWSKYTIKMLFLPSLSVLLLLASAFQIRQTINRKFELFSKAFEHLLPTIVVISSGLHSFLVSSAVQPLNCIRSDTDSSSAVFVMAYNPSYRCYDQQWYIHLPLVLLFCILYGLVLPLTVGYALFVHRTNIDEPKFSNRYGVLFKHYRREYFFWELVLMLKKVTLILTVQFLSTRKKASYGVKFTSSISIIGFYLALEAVIQPYFRKSMNFRSST